MAGGGGGQTPSDSFNVGDRSAPEHHRLPLCFDTDTIWILPAKRPVKGISGGELDFEGLLIPQKPLHQLCTW